jgi:hypothetical protein
VVRSKTAQTSIDLSELNLQDISKVTISTFAPNQSVTRY